MKGTRPDYPSLWGRFICLQDITADNMDMDGRAAPLRTIDLCNNTPLRKSAEPHWKGKIYCFAGRPVSPISDQRRALVAIHRYYVVFRPRDLTPI